MTFKAELTHVHYALMGIDETELIPKEATSELVAYYNGVPDRAYFIQNDVPNRISMKQHEALHSIERGLGLQKIIRLLEADK